MENTTSLYVILDGLEYESWRCHVVQDRTFRKVLSNSTTKREMEESKQSPTSYEAWS